MLVEDLPCWNCNVSPRMTVTLKEEHSSFRIELGQKEREVVKKKKKIMTKLSIFKVLL